MTSSSGGGTSDMLGAILASRPATPMPGLPVAGQDSSVGDPHEYGTFQSFLPEIQAEGRNPSATGLRPEMFEYRRPSGVVDPEVQDLRDQLAQLQASAAAPAAAQASNPQWAMLRAQMSPQDLQAFRSRVSPEEFNAFMGA